MQEDPLKKTGPQVIYFLHVPELVGSGAENLAGTQVTMKEEVGHPLLTGIREQTLETLPPLVSTRMVSSRLPF